ncbi:MAG: hypothetical protein J6Y96_01990 [Mycoplasma sp.]|nr:hypothetical protein [Mycoplasma sp.]
MLLSTHNSIPIKLISIKLTKIICVIKKSKISFLFPVILLSYIDLAIPENNPIIGSWIAYIQNHTPLGLIKKHRLSVTTPKNNPCTGPKIQPIIITGIHASEIDWPVAGTGILNDPNIILNANNTAIVIRNLVVLYTRYGYKGNKNLEKEWLLFDSLFE